MAYDRKNKKTMLVSEKKGLPSIAYEMIALGNDYMLWSTSEKKENQLKYIIMRYDFASQKVALFRENAAEPIIGKNLSLGWNRMKK